MKKRKVFSFFASRKVKGTWMKEGYGERQSHS